MRPLSRAMPGPCALKRRAVCEDTHPSTPTHNPPEPQSMTSRADHPGSCMGSTKFETICPPHAHHQATKRDAQGSLTPQFQPKHTPPEPRSSKPFAHPMPITKQLSGMPKEV
ncbi:hypothetical protein DUNSADRAFT_8839 [Dunaliella salina]|uniref:Encoded protein n=1 Tax=Dunaliella salina TaxID=3046 RepID=A0ABQ7H5L7_DUNSA|nr:hypothetical protein DUNSADRAFT_8839 [Dunaliella salina]|eukprot:KAF5842152.1 hypothetical protein DUNSADRAFT_8839 [Dunaliella salina]